MPNSVMQKSVPQKVTNNGSIAKAAASEGLNIETNKAQNVQKKPQKPIIFQTVVRGNISPGPCRIRSSSASSRQIGDGAPKPKSKFLPPRINKLVGQRLFNAAQANRDRKPTPRAAPKLGRNASQATISLCSQTSDLNLMSCSINLKRLELKLHEIQSEFIREYCSSANTVNEFKLVAVRQGEKCLLLVHDEDLHGLPKDLPLISLNDLKKCCHDVIKSVAKFTDEYTSVMQLVKDDKTAEIHSVELRSKFEADLNIKKEVLDYQMAQICSVESKSEGTKLLRQINEMRASNENLKQLCAKQEIDVANLQRANNELVETLKIANENCYKVAEELANKNIKCSEQNDCIEDLGTEIVELKNKIENFEQCKKESENEIERFKKMVQGNVAFIDEQSIQLDELEADKKFFKEQADKFSQTLAEKERLLTQAQQQVKDLEEFKEWQETKKEQELLAQLCKLKDELTLKDSQLAKHKELQEDTAKQAAEMKEMQARIRNLSHEITLSATHTEMSNDLKRKLQCKLKKSEKHVSELLKKIEKLERQVEDGIKVMSVRGETINLMELELKQRELDHNRKIKDAVSNVANKNLVIKQITNQLSATNEQFENMCATLSIKEAKLHSQDNMIQMLEKSNARSVTLHTKLAEKNAVLKDELDSLRHTVRIYIEILIGNNGHSIFEPVPADEVQRLRNNQSQHEELVSAIKAHSLTTDALQLILSSCSDVNMNETQYGKLNKLIDVDKKNCVVYATTTEMLDMNSSEEARQQSENKVPGKRDQWGKGVEFLFSCIALSVGLGNVWRFPFIALENGGGAFLIPYLVVLLLVGRPIYYMEVIIGQFSSRGCLGAFDMAPIMKGVAYGQVYSTALATTYYACIMALTIRYLVVSFSDVLPWTYCLVEWGSQCVATAATGTNSNSSEQAVSSAELYFTRTILREPDNLNEGGLGTPSSDMVLCLLATWIIIASILLKGIRSSGKASYFLALFPYVIMLILLVRAVTLPGAWQGIVYFVKPQWNQLLNPHVWYAAITQMFFSLAICFGTLVMYASFNDFHKHVHKDVIIITSIDSFTSILAGCIIFGILGNLAHETNTDDISSVVKGGAGLAFISYPEAIAKFKYMPQLFAVLFFFMLLVLGIGSNIGMASCVINVVKDRFPQLPHWQLATGASMLGFLCGLVYMTPGGQFVLNLVDFYGCTFIALVLAIAELLAVAWIYGVKRLCSDIEFMLNVKTSFYWRICWALVAPGLMFLVLVYMLLSYEPLTYKNVPYPQAAYMAGWLIWGLGVAQLPFWAIYTICQQPGNSLRSKLKLALQPTADWGPRQPQLFQAYVAHRQRESEKKQRRGGFFFENIFG